MDETMHTIGYDRDRQGRPWLRCTSHSGGGLGSGEYVFRQPHWTDTEWLNAARDYLRLHSPRKIVDLDNGREPLSLLQMAEKAGLSPGALSDLG